MGFGNLEEIDINSPDKPRVNVFYEGNSKSTDNIKVTICDICERTRVSSPKTKISTICIWLGAFFGFPLIYNAFQFKSKNPTIRRQSVMAIYFFSICILNLLFFFLLLVIERVKQKNYQEKHHDNSTSSNY